MIRLEHRTLYVALAIGLLAAPACGDGDSIPSDDAGNGQKDASSPGKDAASPGEDDAGDEQGDHDGGAAGDGAAAMDTGTPQDAGGQDAASGDGSVASPTCSAYCTTLKANCSGANAQYTSDAVCMAVCTSFPVGAASDTSGNTLGCRLYHAGAAASDATTHCNHAGITGGDKDPTDSAPGTCGEGCEAFCNEAVIACTSATSPGGTAPYATKAACMIDCKTFPAATNTFSTAATSGDTFNCRAYHLTAASTTPDPHCGHIKKVSSTCQP
jgi:hypothetical protein